MSAVCIPFPFDHFFFCFLPPVAGAYRELSACDPKRLIMMRDTILIDLTVLCE